MTPLHAIDGGRHRILSVRYGLPENALIPLLLRGAGREADALLALARELRARRIRAGLVHLRRAWIAHCCGSLALYELEAERAHAQAYLRHNPLIEVAGSKLVADDRRRNKLLARNRARNRKVRDLAAKGIGTDTLRQRFGLSARQTRRIKGPSKR